MTERTTHRLAWAIWIVGLMAFVGSTVFQLVEHEPFQPADLSEPLAFAAIGVVGLIVALHQPRNAIGWLLLWTTLTIGPTGFRVRRNTPKVHAWLPTPAPFPVASFGGLGVQLGVGSGLQLHPYRPFSPVSRRPSPLDDHGGRSHGRSASVPCCGRSSFACEGADDIDA